MRVITSSLGYRLERGSQLICFLGVWEKNKALRLYGPRVALPTLGLSKRGKSYILRCPQPLLLRCATILNVHNGRGNPMLAQDGEDFTSGGPRLGVSLCDC